MFLAELLPDSLYRPFVAGIDFCCHGDGVNVFCGFVKILLDVCKGTSLQIGILNDATGKIMVAIGGKSRKPKLPSQPQVVVQRAPHVNEFASFGVDDRGLTTLAWIGDPNAASKFNSKYEAKSRVRQMESVPDTRVFRALEVAS